MDGFLSLRFAGHPVRRAIASARSSLPRLRSGRAPIALALAIAALSPAAARSQALDPGDVAAGMRLFRQTGGCQLCHGWAADGRKMDNQMPDGANLRETTLDRQSLILTIKCGRPGRGMPAFDKFAYSDGRCYGLKQADLKAGNLQMEDPPTTLAPNEVDFVADFLFAKIIGKGPMDHAKCVEYWGSDVDACCEFPK